MRLKSDIPLPVKVVYLDRDPEEHQKKRWVTEDEIRCEPMRALWQGIKDEGWPQPREEVVGVPLKVGGGKAPDGRGQFTEDSYAILSHEYMIVSLRMGYHFTTIEAMCTDEPNKNFIRLQYKQGGAALDRRLAPAGPGDADPTCAGLRESPARATSSIRESLTCAAGTSSES